MDDISAKVLEKIEKEKIAPTPRWMVLCRRGAVWIVGGMSLLIGGLAMSVVIFMVVNNEWSLAHQLAGGRVWFVLVTLPYAWLLMLGAFLFLAENQVRHTPHGYRIATVWLIGGSVGLSILLGIIFYAIGAGQRIDDTFTRKMPYYTDIGNRRAKMLQQPERGVVGGVLLEVAQDELSLRAIDTHVWRVYFEDARLMNDVELVPGVPILVVGENVGDFTIQAKVIKEIRPGHGQPRYAPDEFEKIRRELRNRQ